jgi:NDP-sugar pyrophosphorylase family protein
MENMKYRDLPMPLPFAIVLTAGLGTRLAPITSVVAKPAVPVGGKALVVRVLEWLAGHGVSDAILNLHHLPHTITRLVGDGGHLGLRVRYSWEPTILGSAGGPRLALSLLPGHTAPLLIVNGDTLTDLDLGLLVEAHARNASEGALVTMAAVPNPRPDHYNGLEIDEAGRVLGVRPKGQADGTWHFIGVQIVDPVVFAGLPLGQPAETVAGLYRDLISTTPGAVRVFRSSASFIDVGTPTDYLDAAWALGTPTSTPGVLIEPGPRDDDGAPVFGAGATFDRCVVWNGATVGGRVSLTRCIVLSDAIVPAGTVASERVF